MYTLEHGLQVVQIGFVLSFSEGTVIEGRDTVDPLSALKRIALDDLFEKTLEGLFLLFGQSDGHAHIDQDDLSLLFIEIYEALDLQLVEVVFLTEFPKKLVVECKFNKFADEIVFGHLEVVGEVCGDGIRHILEPDQDVAGVTVCMDEVVLHQHGEEGLSANISNHFVQVVSVALIESDGFAVDVLLNEDFIS